MNHLRYKILFLASWYPSRLSKVSGVFIKRKAEAVAQLCDVALIYVVDDPSAKATYEVDLQKECGVQTVRVYFKASHVPILRGFIYNFRYLKSYFLGWRAVKRVWGAPDLVHANVVDRAGYIALLLKYLKGIQYVITEHSTPDIDFVRGTTSTTSIPFRPLKSIIIRNSEYTNVDSQTSLQYLLKAGFKGRFCVIPNVVHLEEEVLQHRREHTPSRRKIGLHISNLIERKNVADIICAFSDIYTKKTRRDFELQIVGEGGQLAQLRKLAAELGVLDKCIYFRGLVDDKEKARLFMRADFHVLNSDEEGFSVVTAEAISYGTPVIATKSGGPEDFVTEEVGLLIERRNPDELQRAILHMLDNSHKYDKRKLRAYGKSKFSSPVVAHQTYDMYTEALTWWRAGNTARKIRILPRWKVLDVGSGHQPNRRANVLLERYLEPTIHRTTDIVLMPDDKSLIVGDALKMPFRNNEFDFVVASHIAEHVDDPEGFCKELQRVAKRGYLETPGPLTEFLMPTASHKWVVAKIGKGITFWRNRWKKPPSSLFFRFFYLNREGYGPDTLYSNNPVMRILNLILLKVWKWTPLAYARLQWNDRFSFSVHGRDENEGGREP
jgi:glycosyltransferase involved in cell wall biosynthesis